MWHGRKLVLGRLLCNISIAACLATALTPSGGHQDYILHQERSRLRTYFPLMLARIVQKASNVLPGGTVGEGRLHVERLSP